MIFPPCEIDYNHYMNRLMFPCFVIVVFSVSISAAAEKSSSESDFFEREVRPLLVSRCMECHGPGTQENGLRLDSLDRLL